METKDAHKLDPSDVTDDEWAFVAPYPMPMDGHAPQRRHDLRVVFNALRGLMRTGDQWRYWPTNFPSRAAVSQQTRRWVIERSFAWAARFRRLVRDDERLPEPVAGLHSLAFACLMLHRMFTLAATGP